MSQKVVYSLVANAATNDARVMKQARALRDAGYRVILFGRTDAAHPATSEVVDGIEVRRFHCFSPSGLSAEQVARAAELTPTVAAKVAAHAEALISWTDRFNEIVERKHGARARLTSIADRASSEMSRKQTLRDDIIQGCPIEDRSVGLWAGIGRKIADLYPALNDSKTAAVKRVQAAKLELRVSSERLAKLVAEREQARDEVNALAEEERRHRDLAVSNDDVFFSRYAVYAAQFERLPFGETPDFIHCHDLYPLLGGVLVGARTGAKVIFDAHEIETERVPPLPDYRKHFIDRLERDLFLEIDQIVTCCDSSTVFYSERFGKRTPVVVMNAPEIAKSEGEPDFDIRSRLSISAPSKIVIYTGGVGREGRGLHMVTEALRLLDDYHLVILGPRHVSNDKWLMDKAEAAGVHERVHLLPGVAPEQVVAAVRSADVGICPIQDVSLSYRYAMPNKLFEMTFAELPICVSDLPEMSKFVNALGVGLVMDETDPQSIAAALKEAVCNRSKFVLAPASRQVLDEKYSWRSQTTALVGAYQELGS